VGFGAFLVLRHPNLDLLVWPSDSGPTYEAGEGRTTAYIDAISNTLKTGRRRCSKKLSADAQEYSFRRGEHVFSNSNEETNY
jgi:hypothetical protein